ncbi:MAG TPA: response regulator [Desulfosalsimonadaceae bacterium]|nr:response regulator [Desulfosalsimonadaceae bacterium]
MTTQAASLSRNTSCPAEILLMEDEVVVAEGVRMVLDEEGYHVKIADTGQKALDELGGKNYDLLVADLRLPDIDGMDVIKKTRETNTDTNVIVITGYGTVDIAVEAMRLGVADYIPKPFTEEQIRSSVQKALAGERMRTAAGKEQEDEQRDSRLIEKQEVMRVLNRTSEDKRFWQQLFKDGSAALKDYKLSSEAKAAILSGDLGWLNANIGELTQKQLMFIYKQLEKEVW